MITVACLILGPLVLGLFVANRMAWAAGKDVMPERDYYAP